MKTERYSEIYRRLLRRALTTMAEHNGVALPPLAGLTRDAMHQLAADLNIDVPRIRAAAHAEFHQQAPTTATPDDATEASEANEAEAEASDEDTAMPQEVDAIAEAAERDYLELTSLWAAMDPLGFKARLRELTALANRPPVEIVREIIVHAPAIAGPNGVTQQRPSPRHSQRKGQTTASAAFSVAGRLGETVIPTYDGSEAPAIDPDYVWIDSTGALLSRMFRRGRPVWLAGPAGTGKTEWAKQVAARLGRPFVRITCTATTEAATLLGMTVPSAGGGVVWQDGSLTAALRRPGAVILIDEPTVARSGSLYAFQSLLDGSRAVTIEETGEVVPIHPDACFVFADNTNGSGDASGHYVGTGPISAALINRMGAMEHVDYLPAEAEAGVIVAKTGAPRALAKVLVAFAAITRTKATSGEMGAGLGLRALLSWAEQLVDGVPSDQAARLAFVNAAPQDVVTQLTQLLATHAPAGVINHAAGIATDTTATAEPRRHGFTQLPL